MRSNPECQSPRIRRSSHHGHWLACSACCSGASAGGRHSPSTCTYCDDFDRRTGSGGPWNGWRQVRQAECPPVVSRLPRQSTTTAKTGRAMMRGLSFGRGGLVACSDGMRPLLSGSVRRGKTRTSGNALAPVSAQFAARWRRRPALLRRGPGAFSGMPPASLPSLHRRWCRWNCRQYRAFPG